MRLLQRHRLSKGMTLRDLAREVKVHVSTVQAWERGRNLPRPKHIPPLARVLGISTMTLTQLISPECATPA